MTATFEIGKTYTCKSVFDHEAVFSYTIANRTAKTITTACGKTLRINGKLSEYRGSECVLPLGNYSMAPVLQA